MNQPGYKELLAYAKAEQLLADETEYSEEAQNRLRKKLKMPKHMLCIGDHLEQLRHDALKAAATPTPSAGT